MSKKILSLIVLFVMSMFIVLSNNVVYAGAGQSSSSGTSQGGNGGFFRGWGGTFGVGVGGGSSSF